MSTDKSYRTFVQRSRRRISAVMGADHPSGPVLITTANWLTIARMAVIPFFWWFFFHPSLWMRISATVIFIFGALSDLWDGKLARRRRQITPFGDFIDPLADKAMVLSAFWVILLREDFGSASNWAYLFVALITIREVGITLLRVWAIGAGGSLITSYWGKLKTGVQLVSLILTLLLFNLKTGLMRAGLDAWLLNQPIFYQFISFLFFICAMTSLISGWHYIRSPSTQ